MAKQHYSMINIYLSNCRKRFTRASLLLLFLLCSTIVSAQQVVVTLQDAGTLETVIGDNKLTITNLKVTGPINSTDIATLKDMAKNGALSILDLSGATATTTDLIGASAFEKCAKLTSISLPQNVTSIGDYAFYNCSKLTSITIPSLVTNIGFAAFCYCSSLTEVVLLGDDLPGCGDYAFYRIPDDVTLYCPLSLVAACKNNETDGGWNTFKSFASTVTLASDEHLSSYITSDDIKSSITKLTVSGEINSTDISLLKDMSTSGALSVLDLSGATAATTDLIGEEAFSECTKLTSISLPKNVTSIGEGAFYGCSSLNSVSIPNSVTSIGNGAFDGCSKLESITIPSSVTSIGNGAFCCCSSLTSITIPNSVTDIGYRAFDGCTNLTSITIPNSVTSIGESAFFWCSSLTSVTIPNSVTSIGEYAFNECTSLTSVTIGKSVTEIGEGAFYNCSKLKEVILRGKVFPTCGSYAFYNVDVQNVDLYYRDVLKTAFANADTWKDFTNKGAKKFSITIPECGYATGCFYDDLDFSEETDVAAYIVSAFSPTENTVLLTRAKKIPAETGFVVYGKADTYDIPATTTDYVYSNMLVSVVDKTMISQTEDDYTNYTLHKDAEGNVAFVLVDAKGEDVSGYKAYLQIPTSAVSANNESSTAKTTLSLSFDDDDDTTGISEIKEQSNRMSSETVIYNLNGQRKQSLTKGLNIVNGKKIFIK